MLPYLPLCCLPGCCCRLYRWEPAVAVAALEEAVTAWRCREQYVVGMVSEREEGEHACMREGSYDDRLS